MIRGNHAPYRKKALRKAIIKRSELETKFYKTKSVNDHKLYKMKVLFILVSFAYINIGTGGK